MNAIRSWNFIFFGGAFLFGLWLHSWGLDMIVNVWPPYQTTSLTVITDEGVPTKVTETRDIVTDFDGTWRVRVVNLDRGEIVCTLPQVGPRMEAYRITETPAYAPSWREYTGDDGECIKDMLESPGTYQLRTQRTMNILWRDVDLPTVVSAPFRVGAAE